MSFVFAACHCGSFVRVHSDFSFQSYSTSCENDKCPLRDGEGYVMRHAAFALKPAQCWSRVWGRHSPTSGRPCDRTFSSIENLWPQVDTCFRPFRATLKISEVEPQCTLKILQSKTCEKAKPLLMVTVHTERSSYPCFAAALSGSPTESVRSWHSITFRRLMKDSRYSMKKAGRSADTTTCFFQAQE